MIAFRDRLVRHRTVEAAYLDLVRRGVGATPPLFINQLVHVILRNLLDGCDDVFVLRAAELFFRPQRLSVVDGSLLAADEEKVSGESPQPLSPRVAMLVWFLLRDEPDLAWRVLEILAGRIRG